MKKYINKENEVEFYYAFIYFGFFQALLTGILVIQGISEGRGIGYISFFSAGVVTSIWIGINSLIKYKKKKFD